jgi:hypothetical protein
MLTCIITIITITPAQAKPDNSRYEMMLEDIIFTFLSPLQSKAIKEYFGEPCLSDFCKFVDIKTEPDQHTDMK